VVLGRQTNHLSDPIFYNRATVPYIQGDFTPFSGHPP